MKPVKPSKNSDLHNNGATTIAPEAIKKEGQGNHLTPKQEKFALLVAQGMTQADAYRGAYSAEKMKPETVQSKASILMADGKVRARVDEHRTKAAAAMNQEVSYEYADAMKEVDAGIAFARECGSASALMQGLALKAKLSGLMVEDRQNNRSPVSGMDHNQVKAALEALQAIKKARAPA